MPTLMGRLDSMTRSLPFLNGQPILLMALHVLYAKCTPEIARGMMNKMDSYGAVNRQAYLVIFAAACNETFIHPTETRVNCVVAGCHATELAYFTFILQIPEM